MKRIIKIVLSFFAGALGSTIILFIIGYFGIVQTYKIFVVMSGSMEPTLKVGSIAFVIPYPQYFSNDIITFTRNGDKKNPVTHRIISKIYKNGNPPVYLTNGDANKTLDSGEVTDKNIIGKVVFSIPNLGYFVNFVKDPKGFILFVIVPITIIIYEELKSVKKEFVGQVKKIKNKKEDTTSEDNYAGINKAYVIVPIITIAFALAAVSNSFFTDKETSTGNVLSAGVWITPTITPTIIPTIVPDTPTPTPTWAQNLADHIVISEIQTKGNGSSNMFVEFYNPTNSNIDISSWSFQYRGPNATGYEKKNFVAGNVIQAHGFFLFGHSGSGLSPSPDITASISLGLSGGTVFLVSNQIALNETTDNGSTVVDKVAYGTGSYLRPEGSSYLNTPSENQSLERKAHSISTVISMMSGVDVLKGNANDTENNLNDFILRTTSLPQNSGSSIEIP